MDIDLLLEAYEVTTKLNDELYGEFDVVNEFFELRACGWNIFIYFADCAMWRSDEDERDFDEDKNEYEPLEGYIRKRFNDYIARLVGKRL